MGSWLNSAVCQVCKKIWTKYDCNTTGQQEAFLRKRPEELSMGLHDVVYESHVLNSSIHVFLIDYKFVWKLLECLPRNGLKKAASTMALADAIHQRSVLTYDANPSKMCNWAMTPSRREEVYK